MEKLIFILVLASFFACSSHSKSKYPKPDTATIIVGFNNKYFGGIRFDTAIRVVHDSAHIDGDEVEHIPDTTYYLRVSVKVADPKDSTHKLSLKTVDGWDSLVVMFVPFRPSDIFTTYPPSTPYTLSTLLKSNPSMQANQQPQPPGPKIPRRTVK